MMIKNKKSGVTLPEVSISFLIIIVSLIIFFTIANNYIVNLVKAEKMFLIINANQELIELTIALRNKNLEINPSNWFVNEGRYCIKFEDNQIKINPLSSDFCDLNYTRGRFGLILEGKIEVRQISNDIVSVISTVKSKEKTLPESNLNIILTKWHPFFE